MPRSYSSIRSIEGPTKGERRSTKNYSTVSSGGGKRRVLTYGGTPTISRPASLKKAKRQAGEVRGALQRVRRARAASTPDVSSLDPEQDRVLDTIMDVARRRGESKRAQLSATETGLVESNLKNLGYGDADSEGWRQERTSIYGTGKKGPRNVKASAKRFFDELKVQGAGAATPGQAAQAAQGSAFPERYDQEEPKARQILRDYRSQAKKPPGTKKARKVLAKAGVSPKPKAAPKAKRLPGAYAGSQKAVLSHLPKGVRAEGKGDKRTPAYNASVGGAADSDHLTTNSSAYAADIPPSREVYNTIQRRLGLPVTATGMQTVTKDGYRYQLIYGAEYGHDDHIHLGAEWVGGGNVPPSGGGSVGTSSSGGTTPSPEFVSKISKKTRQTDKRKLLRKARARHGSSGTVDADLEALEKRYGAVAV